MKKFLGVLLGLLIVAPSCLRDGSGPKPDTTSKTVTIRLRASNGFSRTRGLTVDKQNEIKEVDVLAFLDGKLKLMAEGVVSTAGGSTTVKVDLPTNGATKYDLVLLANCRTILTTCNVQGLVTGGETAYDAVVAAVHDEITGKMYTAGTENIPMFGSVTVHVLDGPDSEDPVKLYRALARVDVGVGEEGADGWAGSTDFKFELTSVHVVRPNNSYSLMPFDASFDASKADGIVATSVPAEATKFTVDESVTGFAYTVTGGIQTTNDIFIPEAKIAGDVAHGERMALVLGGKYNEGVPTYYRVDFRVNESGTATLKDVLRNHLYQVSVTNVRGNGFATVKEAYEHDAMNIDVDVKAWSEDELIDMETWGKYYVSMPGQVRFAAWGGQTQSVTIKTNVPDFAMTLGSETLKVGSPVDNANFGYELVLADQSGEDCVYTLTVKAKKANVSSGAPVRTEAWTYPLGPMKITFTVSQQGEALIAVPKAPAVSEAAAPHILYWDGTKMQVGRWGVNVNPNNVLYFKHGSVVGVTAGSGSDMFTADDVKFSPSGAMITKWADVPAYSIEDYAAGTTISGGNYHVDANLSNGKGDPCRLAGLTPAQAKNLAAQGKLDEYDSGYRLPARNDNEALYPQVENFVWTASFYPGRWLSPEANMASFLPVAGYRDATTGVLSGVGMTGYYWTSNYSNATNGVTMRFDETTFSKNSSLNMSSGAVVRCVVLPKMATGATLPTAGVKAPPGVLGVGATTGMLTLQGSQEYASNADLRNYALANYGGLAAETVYMVFFKWGSLIATSSVAGDIFDAKDVNWAPGSYNLVSLLRDQIGSTTGTAAWAKVPYTTGGSWPATPDVANALGDPCAFAEKGSSANTWRTPNGNPWNGTTYTMETMPVTEIEGIAGRYDASNPGWFFPYTGYRAFDGDANVGKVINTHIGPYWTATPYSALSANFMKVTASNVGPNDYYRYQGGLPVRCVPQTNPPAPRAPYILYWDEGSGTLAAGASAGVGGAVNDNNMLYFRKGATAGFVGTGDYSATMMRFNTTNLAQPAYGDLAAATGDPCRLVGLTPAEAKTIDLAQYSSGLRMPTAAELGELYSTTAATATYGGVSGLAIDDTRSTFLPLTKVYNNGVVVAGNMGYWDAAKMLYGNGTTFASEEVAATYGAAVRCVPIARETTFGKIGKDEWNDHTGDDRFNF